MLVPHLNHCLLVSSKISSSSIISKITESGRVQGALNITGYSTELLDCSVVARYNVCTKSEGTVVRSPL